MRLLHSRTRSAAGACLLAASLLAANLLVPTLGHAETPADPSGTWLTEDGRGRIRVEYCGPKQEQICGYVVWMKEANDANGQPRRDKANPDRAKQSRVLLGHQLILGLKLNADDRFAGRIYNADNGKKYDITLWRESSEELRIKGCMLAVLCGSQTWALVKDLAPGQLSGQTGHPGGPKPDPEWAMTAPK